MHSTPAARPAFGSSPPGGRAGPLPQSHSQVAPPQGPGLKQPLYLLREAESMEEVYEALAERLLHAVQATPPSRKYMVAIAGPPGAGKSTVAAAVASRVNAKWRSLHGPSAAGSAGAKAANSGVPAGGAAVEVAEGGGAGSAAEPTGNSQEADNGVVGLRRQGGAGSAEEAADVDTEVAVAVPMDGFHLYRWQLDCAPDPKEAHARRGAPWTFDPAALARHLARIRDRGSGHMPSFDHGVGDPVERGIFVSSGIRAVLVEGNYLLLEDGDWRLLAPIFDERWFVEVEVDEAMERVWKRHVSTGTPPEDATWRIEYNDRPNAQLIMETRNRADIIIRSLPMSASSSS